MIKGIGRGLVPPRIELFTWLAIFGKINTRVKLAHICVIPCNEITCVLCNLLLENHDHLLLHCQFSWQIWAWWLNVWTLKWIFPSSLKEAFKQWPIKAKGIFFKKVWMASFYIILWTIWKERNARIFNNTSLCIPQLQDLILVRLSWWIKWWGDPFPYSCDEILKNPSCLSCPLAKDLINSASHPPLIWNPPPHGHVKWNVDASVSPDLHVSAIGGVLRGSNGCFKCMFSSPIPPIEISYAEILVIYKAI